MLPAKEEEVVGPILFCNSAYYTLLSWIHDSYITLIYASLAYEFLLLRLKEVVGHEAQAVSVEQDGQDNKLVRDYAILGLGKEEEPLNWRNTECFTSAPEAFILPQREQ